MTATWTSMTTRSSCFVSTGRGRGGPRIANPCNGSRRREPDPGNPQEIYLESLYTLGIRREEHDIRFVEDNWKSPVLGAWGLGWEVWLDGLEITQFTYFQQSGGFPLDPVAVELTYGLERIVMYLQGVRSVWDIDWDGQRTYGQVLLPQEVIGRWVGAESGLRGLLIGSIAGGLAPGGPYVSLPIAAGLLKSGAGVGTMVAFLTGWSLLAFGRLPLEVGILGWKLTAIRFASTLIFAPIAGLIAHLLFRSVKL